jgi:hypothetical protein
MTKTNKIIGVLLLSMLGACSGAADEGESDSGTGRDGLKECNDPSGACAADPETPKPEDCNDPLAACAADPETPKPAECPPVPFACAEGTFPGDTNGDGCDDDCVLTPRECPPIPFACAEGTFPGDTDGDGCEDDCVAMQ